MSVISSHDQIFSRKYRAVDLTLQCSFEDGRFSNSGSLLISISSWETVKDNSNSSPENCSFVKAISSSICHRSVCRNTSTKLERRGTLINVAAMFHAQGRPCMRVDVLCFYGGLTATGWGGAISG